jgi:hypothetical protein
MGVACPTLRGPPAPIDQQRAVRHRGGVSESKPGTGATDLGVVDPMRIPGLAAARQRWRSLPRLAQVFVALVGVDLVIRAAGLFGTGMSLDLADPLGTSWSFFPHDLLILLPALIVWRRPDALESMPLVTQGAVAVAITELLSTPLRGVVSGNAADPFTGPTIIAVTATLVTAGGWLAIARGMRWFSPAKPDESIAGLANVVAGGLALGAIAGAIGALFLGNIDVGQPLWNDLVRLNNAILSLSGLALAYLAWVVVRGTRDPERPFAATSLATVALAALAVGSVLNPFVGPGPVWLLVFLLTHPAATTALVVAFALGLADPSGTIVPAVQTEQPVSA